MVALSTATSPANSQWDTAHAPDSNIHEHTSRTIAANIPCHFLDLGCNRRRSCSHRILYLVPNLLLSSLLHLAATMLVSFLKLPISCWCLRAFEVSGNFYCRVFRFRSRGCGRPVHRFQPWGPKLIRLQLLCHSGEHSLGVVCTPTLAIQHTRLFSLISLRGATASRLCIGLKAERILKW